MVDRGLQRIGGRGFLEDSDEDDDLYTIHGIAIGSGDITIGSKSGERKLWTEEVLRDSASTLEGKHIVANHENQDVYSVVGSITDAAYSEEQGGVVYQGVIDDALLAKRIERGWLDVSPRIVHTSGEENEMGVKVPGEVRYFDNLALVTTGAAPSNNVEPGEAEELSVEELQAEFDEEPDIDKSEFELVEELQDGIDYSRYLYDNEEGAEGAAEALGCEGFHEHDMGDETYYMPCNSHDSFIRTIREENMSEREELEEVDVDKREIGAALAEIWGVSTGEALDFMNAVDPEEPEDRRSIATIVAREYDGLNPVDVQEILADAEENSEEMAFEGDKSEYSSEERKMASYMASHSELTKSECLSIIDTINPGRQTDSTSMAHMLYKIMGPDEMEKFYSELRKKYKEKASGRDSILNSILD